MPSTRSNLALQTTQSFPGFSLFYQYLAQKEVRRVHWELISVGLVLYSGVPQITRKEDKAVNVSQG